MHAVVAQEVGVGLGAAEVIDGNRRYIVAPALDEGAQDETSDPAEAVDGYFYTQGNILPLLTDPSTWLLHVVHITGAASGKQRSDGAYGRTHPPFRT